MKRRIGVIMSLLFMVFEVLSTLLLTPFIIKSLGQAEYGVYKLSAVLTAYLMLLDLGVGNAVIRYVSRYRLENKNIENRKFIGITIIFYLVIAILSLIIGLLMIAFFPKFFSKGLTESEINLSQSLMFITVLNATITLGTSSFSNILIAYEKFSVAKGGSIIQICIRVILTFIVLKLGMGSIGIVIVNLLVTTLLKSYFVWYALKKIKIKPIFKNIEFTFIKEIVIYSSFILMQMVATQLNASVDQILIGVVIPSSATILAIYGVGTQIVQYFQSIGNAFNGILMPGVVKVVLDNNIFKIEKEMIRIGRITFMILSIIFIGFVCFGKIFVSLWAGSQNNQAYYVALILMFIYLFILTESIGSQVLWAMNEHKEQAIIKFAIVIVNIALTYFLVKWHPIYGPTIGTFISLFIGDFLVMNLIFKMKIHISLRRYYSGLLKNICPCIIITILFGFLINLLLSESWMSLSLGSMGLMIFYIIILWIYGMNITEKNMIKSILYSIIKIIN